MSEIIPSNKLGKPTEFESRIRLLHSWDGYNTSIQRAYLWSIAFLIRPIHDVYFIFQQVNLSFDLILYRVCAALIQIENRVAVFRSLTRLGLRLRAKSLSWLSKYFSCLKKNAINCIIDIICDNDAKVPLPGNASDKTNKYKKVNEVNRNTK